MKYAEIHWQADGTPVSRHFGDVYFSRAGGVAESDHVFIRGNDLPRRFPVADVFTLVELGFGSGVNFLLAHRLFRELAPAGARLHYIGIEKHPLLAADRRKILAFAGVPQEETALLDEALPEPPRPGVWEKTLPQCALTLFHMEALEALGALKGQKTAPVDAWFLDGFSPARNPEMWVQPLFNFMAAHTRPGGTLATFSAAGPVRRGLLNAGFCIEKTIGYGRKREMVKGVFNI